MTGISLAEQIAQLEDATPVGKPACSTAAIIVHSYLSLVDFDPEDEVTGHDPEDIFPEDNSAVRDHYIDVG